MNICNLKIQEIMFSNPVCLFMPMIFLLLYQKQKEIREPAKA